MSHIEKRPFPDPTPIDREPQFRRLWLEALEAFAAAPFAPLAAGTGLVPPGETAFRIPYLGQEYHLTHPAGLLKGPEDPDPIRCLVRHTLLLRYVLGRQNQPPTGRWLTYREVKGGELHAGGEFQNYVVGPLLRRFGDPAVDFQAAAVRFGGQRSSFGEPGFTFEVLPGCLIGIALYPADEDDPPGANVIFDAAPLEYLPGDDLVFLAKELVRSLTA